MSADFTHLDNREHPRMVDVSHKAITERKAVAQAVVRLGEELFELLKEEGSTSKGPVFQTAIIAGIQGAKKHQKLSQCATLCPYQVLKSKLNWLMDLQC